MVCQYDIKSDVVDFIKRRLGYSNISDDKIKETISIHLGQGTYDEMRDKNGKIIAVIRYEIDIPFAYVIDLAIEKSFPSIYIMKRFTVRGFHRFPGLKYISFERNLKYPLRKRRIYSIKKLLKIGE